MKNKEGKINKRIISILELLIKQEKVITIKELSLKLDVSDRSIRYDLETINEYLEKNSLSIINKLSKGSLEFQKTSLIELLKVFNNTNSFSKSEYREELILIKIVFEEEINISDLCEDFDLSRSSIKMTLKNSEDILSNYNLKLVLNPQKGLRLVGEEESIRKIQLKLLNQFKYNSEIIDFKLEFFRKSLNKYFKNININQVKVFINYLINSLNKVISDEAYNILINYTFVLINRLKYKNCLTACKNENFFLNTLEYRLVSKAVSLIEVSENISLNRYELIKFTDYLLGSHSYSPSFSIYENWIEIEILVKKIIRYFSEVIEIDLNSDNILLEGLINHIKPTIYRAKNNIELENSIVDEFLKVDRIIFEKTKLALSYLEDFLNKSISDNEIAFIGVHFKSAIDRNKSIKKELKNLLIVCGLGFGTSKLIAQQIKNRYDVNIIGTIPLNQLDKYLENKNIDIIITNINNIDIKYLKSPVIVVNTLLNGDDFFNLDKLDFPKYEKKITLSNLMRIIKEETEIKNEKVLINKLKNEYDDLIIDDLKENYKPLSSFLLKESISLDCNVYTWEEAIKASGKLLEKNNCVLSSYTKDMIEAIKINGSYIVMDNLVALPHAKNKNNVLKTGMSLTICSSPVEFPGKVFAKYILAFCSYDGKEHLDALVQFVELLKKYEFDKILSTTQSQKKIIDTIKKYEFLSNFGKK